MFLDENTTLAIHANYPDVVYGVSELGDKMRNPKTAYFIRNEDVALLKLSRDVVKPVAGSSGASLRMLMYITQHL